MLDRSPAEILRAFLASDESGSIFTLPSSQGEWPLYVSSMPDGDAVEDACACLYDTAPVGDGREMKSGEPVQHYGIQLRVRAYTYVNGYDQMLAAFEQLIAISSQEVTVDTSDYLIHCCSFFSGIIPLGAEPGTTKRRDEFTLNFRIAISLVA